MIIDEIKKIRVDYRKATGHDLGCIRMSQKTYDQMVKEVEEAYGEICKYSISSHTIFGMRIEIVG